jgi:hypothetical protein
MISKTKFLLKDVDGLLNRFQYAIMITLTSAEDVPGYIMKSELNRFFVYLKRYLKDKNLYYVVARELQNRGVYHYHIIIFGWKFIPVEALSEFWRLGFVWVSMVTNKEGITYIMKYVNKGGRLHSSYSLLRVFESEYIQWRYFWRRSFFLGVLLDYLNNVISGVKSRFNEIKDWFYSNYESFRVSKNNIKSVANRCILLFA